MSFNSRTAFRVPRALALVGAAGAALTCKPLHADDQALSRLLDALRNNGSISQQTYLQLKEENADNATASKDASPVRIDTHGGLKVETTDGNFSFQLNGRLQADAAFYDQDKTKLGNGQEFRRLELEPGGTIYRDWKYKMQVDFAGNNTNIKDAYLGYEGFRPLSITVGNFLQPFSLENITSDKYNTFMERAMIHEAFVVERRLGIGLSGHGELPLLGAFSAAGGVFGETVGGGETPNEDSSGVGGSVRLTAAPLHTKTELLHLGLSAQLRDPGSGETVRFRSRPDTHVTNVRLVDTGTISDVNNYILLGLEGAGYYGPFGLQGEYVASRVNRSGSDPNYSGWYLQGSWILTGESRAATYKTSDGSFGQIAPASRLGAWELAARYDELNLHSGVADGGKEDNVTLGLNWYPNKLVRLSANYVKVLNVSGGPHAGDEPAVYEMRAQVYF